MCCFASLFSSLVNLPECTCKFCNMYLISGANVHGQWLKKDLVLRGFQDIAAKVNNDGVFHDINQMKLINISWSYNLFQLADKFFLSGSWHSNFNQFIEVVTPKEISNDKGSDLLLIGNDYKLFWFHRNQHVMWAMSLDGQPGLKKANLNTVVTYKEKRFKNDDHIIKVCVSNLNCVCLTASGVVYSGALPSTIETNMCIGKVCDIQCGFEHCLLLTDAGYVYSWGNGRRLQLGHGNLNNAEIPTLVEALAGIKIIKLSAGGWHSLALSEFGDVYGWGWNATGQLGIKNIEKHSDNLNVHTITTNSCGLPTLIDLFCENGDVVNTNVINIACGSLHSAVLLEDNSVWTTGCNKYGQTGFATEIEKLQSFKKTFQCSGKTSIHCGPWVTVIHTLASDLSLSDYEP